MNAAAQYGLEHHGQAMSYAARHGIGPDQREDVVQGALLRCLRQGEQDFRHPQAYWYAALRSETQDVRRGQKGALPITVEVEEQPTPARPIHRSLNGFGTSRDELEAIADWLGCGGWRWRALRKHIMGAPLSVKEEEMMVDLKTRLANIPCRTCGHWIRLHGDGKFSCDVHFPKLCKCQKFVMPRTVAAQQPMSANAGQG
jgi:DNA-directed RNA polymerase specialized sigma24 family protein